MSFEVYKAKASDSAKLTHHIMWVVRTLLIIAQPRLHLHEFDSNIFFWQEHNPYELVFPF